VTYAGLKDRFAVTEQWFGIHVPGKTEYDLSDLDIAGVEVLEYARHNKKLRIGVLSGNYFELILRDVDHITELEKRWQNIVEKGVPNYFGQQRFGIEGGNIDRALALFSGSKVKDKKKRGMYLSAARSFIFNSLISERINLQLFNSLSIGDVLMLAGTQSVFHLDAIDDDIIERFNTKDVDITAPMWGAGELMTTDKPKILEQQIADRNNEFSQGLPRFGLKQERRKIRLSINDAEINILESKPENNSETRDVKICFFLPAGCYATTVLRELVDFKDMTVRVEKNST